MPNSPTHRIKADNLRILRDFLQENFDVVQASLDMQSFCDDYDCPIDVRRHLARLQADGKSPALCGTTLCLAGWTAGIPAFALESDSARSYRALIDNLYSPDNWVYNYLFSDDWSDVLSEGLSRIDRLIRAVEEDDRDFLYYVAEYGDDLVAVHGDQNRESWQDVEYELSRSSGGSLTHEELKAHLPLFETPEWYKEHLA